MAKPVVAVIGSPNVGKSTFFNYIAGKRISIVEDTPGVTRDRIYTEVEWRNKNFFMIDTGGIEPYSENIIKQQMMRQAQLAMDTADVIVFMVDVKVGMTASDSEISTLLRKVKKKVILVVNKVDKIGEPPPEVYEFYNLGLGDFHEISSVHGLGIGDLLDDIYDNLPSEEYSDLDDGNIKVSVIGKPNTGKSSLINRIIGENRVIVSDIPGTTRDAIDSEFEYEGKQYTFIDTAGIRKKSKIYESIEKYSILRAWKAVDRSDVCLLMIDALNNVTEQDTKIAGYAHDNGKACIVVVNKWDLITKSTGTLENYKNKIYDKLSFMTYAPIVFISVKTGKRVEKIFGMVDFVKEQSEFRISTGVLNDFLNEITAVVQPPSDKGKRLKIYYMTQSDIKPPTFILFVNNAELLHYSYERYIENQLRKSFGFEGTPIKFIIREKKE
jgi:GTP-binding protein